MSITIQRRSGCVDSATKVDRDVQPSRPAARSPDSDGLDTLFRKLQLGDAAATSELWERQAKVVARLVRKLRVPEELVADAIQEGMLGVCVAIAGYDPARPSPFSAYAFSWIFKKVRDFVAQWRYRHPIPLHLLDNYCEYRRRRDNCASAVELESLHARMAQVDASLTDRLLAIHRLAHAISLSELGGELVSPSGSLVDDCSAAEAAWILEPAIRSLQRREQVVIKRRYGIGQQKTETLQEVGKRLKLTRERVRQIQEDAEKGLRRTLAIQKVGDDW